MLIRGNLVGWLISDWLIGDLLLSKALVISRATDGVFCHRLKDYTEINGSIYFLGFT